MTQSPATIEFKTLDQLTAREAHELFKLRVDVFVAEQATPFAELDETDAAADTFHVLARAAGVGPALLAEAIEFSRRWPGDLLIDAQSGLTGYYERFGFVPEGEEFLDTGMPHVAMRLGRERR